MKNGVLAEFLGSAFEVFWFFAFFEPPGRKNAPRGPNLLSYINLNPEQRSLRGGPFLVWPGFSDLSKNLGFLCISCIGCA